MKNAVLGLCLGVLLTSAVWWSSSILNTPSPAHLDSQNVGLPAEFGSTHGEQSLDPAARRSIRAFKAIAASLDAGRLAGVREHALAIAEFFAPMNTAIEQSALALAADTDLETAKSHFRQLTQAFQHPPTGKTQPDAFEL